MTTQIVPLAYSNPELTTESASVAIVARELRAQHGAEALDVVEGWAGNGRTSTYATAFWRKVIDEVRRTSARRDDVQFYGDNALPAVARG